MKGDISVNSDPLEAGISAEDREPGLQFTFINDSESGKMNLVGVSKPTPPRLANLMPAWTQIDAGLTPQNREYCTQKLKACKVRSAATTSWSAVQHDVNPYMAREGSPLCRFQCGRHVSIFRSVYLWSLCVWHWLAHFTFAVSRIPNVWRHCLCV